MKITRKHVLALGLVAGLGLGTFNAAARFEVSASVSINAVSDFYEPLGESGSWVEVGSYGRCWHPAGVAVGWRPYCAGEWVWTDCGWYWESDEPWAWACYHYGSWIYDSQYGWVWLPGVEWGPAWVSWRIGGGYIGWAPLAPRHARLASTHFVFVQNNHFCERIRPSAVVVNNTTIINKTTVVGGIKYETRTFGDAGRQKVVFNAGPKIEVVEKATGKKFKAVPVHEAVERTHVPAAMLHSNGGAHGPEGGKGPADSVTHKPVPPPTGQPSLAGPKQAPEKDLATPGNRASKLLPREPQPGRQPSWFPSKRQSHEHGDRGEKHGKDKS